MLSIWPSLRAAPRTLHSVRTILSALASERKTLESRTALLSPGEGNQLGGIQSAKRNREEQQEAAEGSPGLVLTLFGGPQSLLGRLCDGPESQSHSQTCGGGANTQRQLIRAAERKEAIRAFGRGNNRVLQRAAQERRRWFRPSRLLNNFSHSRLAASSISLPRWPFRKNKSIYILKAVLSLVGLRLSVLENKRYDIQSKVKT